MSKKVQVQLASIRREAHRIELQQMREHVKAKRRKLVELEAEEKHWSRARKEERKARLRAMQKAIQALAGPAAAGRKAKLRIIHEKRKLFEQWWAEVRAERARRLAEINKLRQELRDWAKLGPARRKESVAQITEAAMRELAAFDDETRKGLNALEQAVRKARADLKSDEYDLRTWASNRRREAKGVVRAIKKPRGEGRSELSSNIEMNLETPEEMAWWRHGKTVILRDAKELGLTEGDAIAEMVRERVEADPERALEYLQADADLWVEAELRRQGFAA